jgi:hypothetical protein
MVYAWCLRVGIVMNQSRHRVLCHGPHDVFIPAARTWKSSHGSDRGGLRAFQVVRHANTILNIEVRTRAHVISLLHLFYSGLHVALGVPPRHAVAELNSCSIHGGLSVPPDAGVCLCV